jgi:energy-coupling factor transporter ATP-binding protein EcfA2
MSDEMLPWRRYTAVAEVFTPGAPIDQLALFAGRWEQVKDVLNAVSHRGQHVILFGERGVGKTSLANVLRDIYVDRDLGAIRFVKVNCNTGDDFYALWRKIFRELGIIDLEEEPATPDDVRYVLREFETQAALVIIIDELDRLENDEALSLLADTIKTLSDHSIPVTLVLVGVADSIDQLIGDHASIVRALLQVRMPRMSETELVEIIDKGFERLNMTVELRARARIARLSEGLPHYTHALSLHAGQRAALDHRTDVKWGDVSAATDMAVQKAEHTIQKAYRMATRSPQKGNLFRHVLLACALAPKDELGYFKASDVREPMSAIMKRKYDIPAFARHLNAFTNPDRGAVLQKTGTEYRYFYRFDNPLLQPYVIMNGLAKELITDEMLREVQKNGRTSSVQ